MRKYLYLLVAVGCFGVGAYIWKIQTSGFFGSAEELPATALVARPKEVGALAMVEVGGERITQDDVDWEYNLLTEGVFDKDSLTPIPDLGPRYYDELGSLRRSLVSSLSERKMLFTLLKRDRDFDSLDPGRFTNCMQAWQSALQSEPFASASRLNKERLKSRLCERSLVDQYLKERLFATIQVSPDEVVEYYKNHAGEFKQPERVKIRHILLGNEQDARKCRAQATQHNFEALARQLSLAPEKIHGGLLGPFSKGRMPAVFEVAFHLEPGGISDVLKSDYGYHLVMLLEKLPKQQLSLEAVRPKISAILHHQKEEALYGKWVEKALAAIDISTQKTAW